MHHTRCRRLFGSSLGSKVGPRLQLALGLDMAPKKRKSSGEPKATASKKKAVVQSTESLVDGGLLEAEQALQSSSCGRTLKRRSTQEEVERKLQHHFGHLSATDLETKVVDGLTLRETILRDTREARNASGAKSRLGATYWRALVQKFSEGLAGPGQLKVKDANESVNCNLIEALQTAVHPTLALKFGDIVTGICYVEGTQLIQDSLRDCFLKVPRLFERA